MSDSITVILSVYKRDYFDEIIPRLFDQTLKPKQIILFQEENHIDCKKYLDKYPELKHIKSDINTGIFSRFAYPLCIDSEYFIVLDDDCVYGKNWIQICYDTHIKYNSIVSGTGRKLSGNKYNNFNSDLEVDFGCHCWFVKKEWLKYMWRIEPKNYFNGEDIHLSATCKIFGKIRTFVPKQINKEDMFDVHHYESVKIKNQGTPKDNYNLDKYSLSKLPNHTENRNKYIQYLIKKGWKRI